MSVAGDLRAIEARVAAFEDTRPPLRATPNADAFARAVGASGDRVIRGKGADGGYVASLVRHAAARAGVDPALLLAVARTESGLDATATSAAGARGVMQLMPATARSLGVDDPDDPAQNVRGGAAYLHELLERFHGDVRSAVAGYNAGPGAVERFGGVPPYAETQTYVERVLDAYRRGGR